jgi:hypothetical protein
MKKKHPGVTYSKTEQRWLVRFRGYYVGRFQNKNEAIGALKGFQKAFEVI